jgi:hypothetical protein
MPRHGAVPRVVTIEPLTKRGEALVEDGIWLQLIAIRRRGPETLVLISTARIKAHTLAPRISIAVVTALASERASSRCFLRSPR